MGRTLRIATQNIQWGGDPAPGGDGNPRLKRLLPHLARLDADILVLTEHKSGVRGTSWSRCSGTQDIYIYCTELLPN